MAGMFVFSELLPEATLNRKSRCGEILSFTKQLFP